MPFSIPTYNNNIIKFQKQLSGTGVRTIKSIVFEHSIIYIMHYYFKSESEDKSLDL